MEVRIMKKTILIALTVIFAFSLENVFADDDTAAKVQTGISVLGGILNNLPKKKENKQQAAQENKEQPQTNNQQDVSNAPTQNQEPSVSKEDVLMLMKKIKTNLTEEQLTRTAKSMLGISNGPGLGLAPYGEFGYILFLLGEGQFSKQDKERILKKQVGDPGANWKSKIRSITVNAATMMVETDMMTYSGNGMKPDKVDYIFTKAGEGALAFDSIQIASKGVRLGGDQGAMVFSQTMGAIQKFVDEGKHEQTW
jgi:hypothetical protein